VDIATEVGAPLGRKIVGSQRKNRIKGCLEDGSGKKPTGNETEKVTKLICRKFKCPNYGELDHRKNSSKCPHNCNIPTTSGLAVVTHDSSLGSLTSPTKQY
jgi:hypothetical protein